MKPLTSRIRHKKLWGFDIETHTTKNKFLMGSVVGDSGVNKTFWDKNNFIEYIMGNKSLFRGGYICATNLQFDILALLDGSDYIKEMKPLIKNSSFLCASIDCGNRNKINFIDTWNYYKFSVERMGKIIGVPKLDRPSFLGEKPRNNNERLYLEEYNTRDSVISYKFIKFLQENFNFMKAQLKLTSASTSMDLFRRNFMKIDFNQPMKYELKYMYNGYYGGRTEAIKRGRIANLNYYDVNSLYPSAMLNDFPLPTRFKYVKYLRKNALYDYEGVMRVRIKAPKEMYIPYLPVRHDGKLIFPIGEFEGTYTFFEIRRALELGYELIEVFDAVVYFERGKVFADYVKTLYSLRKKYKKNNDPRQLIIKIFLNSLYGKFAQKIDTKEEIVHKDKVTIDMLRDNDFDWSGDWYIIKKEYDRVPQFVNPIFSIYTTAYARDTLFNYMMKVKPENVFYFDTDSLFTSKTLETSNKLGEMKLEGRIKNGVIVKPKMYMIDDKPKCKGVFNIDGERFTNILKTKRVDLRRFVKFKEANRRKLEYNEILNFEKRLDLEDNKRIWGEKFNRDVLQDSQPISLSI